MTKRDYGFEVVAAAQVARVETASCWQSTFVDAASPQVRQGAANCFPK